MPAYNEEGHIYENILETQKTLEEVEANYEIIVVDDGSPDRTFENASRATRDNVLVKKMLQNQGKEQALKFGYQFATGDLIVFLNATWIFIRGKSGSCMMS